jgi:hypothetical protein
MQSPYEAPVDLAWFKKALPGSLTLHEVKGWHIYSLGFAMQVMALKKSLQPVYVVLTRFLYRIDRIFLGMWGWESFAQSGRFIMCSIKLEKE